jgi:uncharacterized spore protein YtfJ
MDDVDQLLKNTVAELDRLLNAKNILGDPIERDGATVIPIVSYGFGFGAGGGTGGDAGGKSGAGAGTAAGGGIRPVGAIIIDANGARVEPVKGMATSLAEIAASTARRAMDRRGRKGADEPEA